MSHFELAAYEFVLDRLPDDAESWEIEMSERQMRAYALQEAYKLADWIYPAIDHYLESEDREPLDEFVARSPEPATGG